MYVAPDVLRCAALQAQQLYLRLLAGLAGREGAEQQPLAGDAFQTALLAVACQLVAATHGVVSVQLFCHCCLSPVAVCYRERRCAPQFPFDQQAPQRKS